MSTPYCGSLMPKSPPLRNSIHCCQCPDPEKPAKRPTIDAATPRAARTKPRARRCTAARAGRVNVWPWPSKNQAVTGATVDSATAATVASGIAARAASAVAKVVAAIAVPTVVEVDSEVKVEAVSAASPASLASGAKLARITIEVSGNTP